VILFAPTAVSPLLKISADASGKPVAVTTLREGETGHVRPSFLPDGRHFLYHVRSGSAQIQGIYDTTRLELTGEPFQVTTVRDVRAPSAIARHRYRQLQNRERSRLSLPAQRRIPPSFGSIDRVIRLGGST
jgi:hypothetical protein